MSQNVAHQIPLDLQHRTALGRDDFLIASSNESAAQWVDRWPDWPAPLLVINGPAASGKSHLAAVWREKTKAEIIKPEMLIARDADEISRVSNHIVIDGIDPWVGEREVETTLFHLYNMFKEEGRSLLVTTRMAPSHMDFTIPDLASRWRAAPVATIDAPDDELMSAILVKMFVDRQLMVGADLIQYVLPRMDRSFAAARDIVAAADSMALSQKRAISIPLMRQVLSEMQGE